MFGEFTERPWSKSIAFILEHVTSHGVDSCHLDKSSVMTLVIDLITPLASADG